MGKNFNKSGGGAPSRGNRPQQAGGRNATTSGKVTRRNISKKESDKKYKAKEYSK